MAISRILRSKRAFTYALLLLAGLLSALCIAQILGVYLWACTTFANLTDRSHAPIEVFSLVLHSGSPIPKIVIATLNWIVHSLISRAILSAFNSFYLRSQAYTLSNLVSYWNRNYLGAPLSLLCWWYRWWWWWRWKQKATNFRCLLSRYFCISAAYLPPSPGAPFDFVSIPHVCCLPVPLCTTEILSMPTTHQLGKFLAAFDVKVSPANSAKGTTWNGLRAAFPCLLTRKPPAVRALQDTKVHRERSNLKFKIFNGKNMNYI